MVKTTLKHWNCKHVILLFSSQCNNNEQANDEVFTSIYAYEIECNGDIDFATKHLGFENVIGILEYR